MDYTLNVKIEIDQSGRVEYTSVPTVVADSLGNSILLTAIDKQLIQKIYRNMGKSRRFVIRIFALLVSLIIVKSYQKTNIYHVDTEYLGKEVEIKAEMFRFLRKLKCPLVRDKVSFVHIGKKSKAHFNAYRHYKNPSRFRERRVKQMDFLEVLI